DRRGEEAWHRGLARSRPQPHLRPPPLVQRPAGVLRLVEGHSERLAVDLHQGPGVALGRPPEAVLPSPVRAAAAGPRLVEPRGARGGRARTPFLVRPRRRRLAHRRATRPRPRPRAPRRERTP